MFRFTLPTLEYDIDEKPFCVVVEEVNWGEVERTPHWWNVWCRSSLDILNGIMHTVMIIMGMCGTVMPVSCQWSQRSQMQRRMSNWEWGFPWERLRQLTGFINWWNTPKDLPQRRWTLSESSNSKKSCNKGEWQGLRRRCWLSKLFSSQNHCSYGEGCSECERFLLYQWILTLTCQIPALKVAPICCRSHCVGYCNSSVIDLDSKTTPWNNHAYFITYV